MEKAAPEMCEVCGRKKATYHLCRPGGDPPNVSLCGECMKTSAPDSVKEFMDVLRAGRCRFCGGQAAATDSLARMIRDPGTEEEFLCMSCSTEYYRTGARYFDGLSDLTGSDGRKQLMQCIEKLDTHMQQWVRQRDN